MNEKKTFEGHVMLYKDRVYNKVYLGKPWVDEKDKPPFVEYDSVAYMWIGEAKITLEIDTCKDFDFANLAI